MQHLDHRGPEKLGTQWRCCPEMCALLLLNCFHKRWPFEGHHIFVLRLVVIVFMQAEQLSLVVPRVLDHKENVMHITFVGGHVVVPYVKNDRNLV